jgi:F-type H+-transporting ATPase subunit b
MSLAIMLAQAAEAKGPIEGIAATFGVDWPHLAAQMISFSIVCALLYLLAYRPILRMLETRRQQIAQGLANAEQIEAELARTRAARQDVLRQARQEAATLIDNARAAAARVRAEETQNAVVAAEQIRAKARDAAARDHARMLGEAKREIGRLVVRTTSAVTGKILTPEDERRLFEETTRQLVST